MEHTKMTCCCPTLCSVLLIVNVRYFLKINYNGILVLFVKDLRKHCCYFGHSNLRLALLSACEEMEKQAACMTSAF